MVEKASVCALAALAFASCLPLVAQNDSFAERERALQRELAAQREAEVEQGARARALAEQERAQQEAIATQERERVAEQREIAAREREVAARQREVVARQREQQQESAEHMRELASELAKAKAQLAASAAEIGRLSAQLSRPVVRDVQNGLTNIRVLGQRAILGIIIENGDAGVRVTGVTPNGPAAAAGVRVGDTITAINGFDLAGRAGNGSGPPTAALLGQLGEVEAGQDVELRVLRDGNSRNLVVKAGEDGPLPFRFEPGNYVAGPSGSWFGGDGDFFQMFRGRWNDVELVSLTPALGDYFGTDEGLLVVRAGRMGELGLRDGDVILELGGRQPQTPEHAMRILASFEPGESLQTSIMRQKRREALTMTVPVAAPGARREDGIF
jgi:hypothetical protein